MREVQQAERAAGRPTAFIKMKVTLTITVPELKTVTRALSSDWGPHIERTARQIGVMVAVAWTICSMVADRWQRLRGWIRHHHLHGLSRVGLPGGAVQAMAVQRQAAAVPAPANIAPPVRVHISEPMARAVRMVRDGRSQRLAASLCGVSRSSLQRALKA